MDSGNDITTGECSSCFWSHSASLPVGDLYFGSMVWSGFALHPCWMIWLDLSSEPYSRVPTLPGKVWNLVSVFSRLQKQRNWRKCLYSLLNLYLSFLFTSPWICSSLFLHSLMSLFLSSFLPSSSILPPYFYSFHSSFASLFIHMSLSSVLLAHYGNIFLNFMVNFGVFIVWNKLGVW